MNKEIRNSQVANIAEFELLDYSALAQPNGPANLIATARRMARAASARRDESLYVELAACFHVALYIESHPEAWDDFCENSEIEEIEYPGGVRVLHVVLKTYTGDGIDAQKKASRYKLPQHSSVERTVRRWKRDWS